MADLSLDERDRESLTRCRLHDCQLQLPADVLTRFQGLAWNSAGAALAADQTLRQLLVDLVNDDRARGSSALMTYVDDERPLSLAKEFQAMVASQPAILKRFPELYRHILDYPRATSVQSDDVLYWSKEKIGPARIISVTHLAIMRPADAPKGAHVAASRQLYGSHYFDSSLGVTMMLDAPVGGSPGMFLTYVNRSRVDVLGGFWGGLKRTIVRSRTRSAIRGNLVAARDLVERRYRAGIATVW